MLGQAVRLPLGIHQLTGRRYPLVDDEGLPCAFPSTRAAVQFVLEQPRVSSVMLADRWQLLATEVGDGADPASDGDASSPTSFTGRTGTHSPVIRWVDRHISPLELLDELAPDTELQKVGRGYLG